MTQTCPVCGNDLARPQAQNFCGSCSEPINVDVDRERIRQQASGFLPFDERKRIFETVTGERDAPHHEYTHVRVEEAAREAVGEFAFLDRWDDFDICDAIWQEMDLSDPDPPSDKATDEVNSAVAFASLGIKLFPIGFLPWIIWRQLQQRLEEESDKDSVTFEETDLEIRLTIEGEDVDNPVDTSMSDLVE